MNWYKIIKISNIENILKNINMKQEYINDITSFLNNISDTRVKGKYIAAIKEGIKSNPNFNINDLRNINIKQNYIPSSKAQELLNRYKNEKIYNWLKKELSKNNEANFQILKDNINHIIDWIKDENIDINNYKLEDAIKLSNEWTSKTFKNASDKYSSNIIDMQFKDGFTIKKLTPEDAKVEGKKMNHCVGSYENRIKNDKVEVYSLRDKNNEPHVTIAVIYGETVTGLKGNSNSNPNGKYGKYIKEWLSKHPEIKFYQDEDNAAEYSLKDVYNIFSEIPKGKEDDEEYILQGLRYSINLLHYISDKLINNKKFWEKAVEINGSCMIYIPDSLKEENICLKAVQSNGNALQYVPEELRTPEICLKAVENNGLALGHVPTEIIFYHPEVCFKAVENDGRALNYVPDRLKTPELCFKAVENNSHALYYVPEKLRTSELCLKAVEKNGYYLVYVANRMKTPEICLKAVENNGYALGAVPKENITPELCLKAVKNNGSALSFVPNKLKTYEICLKAVENNGLVLSYVPHNLKTEELCLKAVEENPDALSFVPYLLRKNEKFIEKIENISKKRKG